MRRCLLLVLAPVLAALVGSGCGGGTGDEGSVPVIRWTTDRDPTGEMDKLVAHCNEENAERWRVEQVVMPPTVDAKREQIIRRLAAGDDGLDLLTIDVVWTAEFSKTGWIVDLTERLSPDEADFVPSAFDTVRYEDRLWAYPMSTNVALMFWRTDLVERAPESWEELLTMSKEVQSKHPDMDGFLFQGAAYEGLTVDALEFLTAAGGSALDESGSTATFDDGDAAAHAFTFMRRLVTEGVSPRETVTFQEEESRIAFQSGNAPFMRNWPYVYALANDPTSKVAGKFDVAPLPIFEGRQRGGVLGGANLAISSFSRHPEQTWEAMLCLGGRDAQRRRAITRGEMPALQALYDEPEVRAAMPYIDVARTSLEHAVPRPATPYYNDLTRTIYVAANKVIAGRLSPDAAVAELQRGAQLAIEGTPEI